ncbi:vacuolar import and degradation protein-domain-containing protein [Nemania sp. NC0429]|nr:vacuolar import and degradation protein-domain-containing protein [Nemania sp. NC0429]
MPTPSSATPPTPPELLSRTHSSSCPDDVRPQSGWSPDEDGPEMNLDNENETDATTSPEAMSAPAAEMAQLLAESRSATESPPPDSRSGTSPPASELVDINPSSHKQTEELADVQDAALRTVSSERHGSRCDVDSPTTEHDRPDDDNGRTSVNYDEFEPSMGFYHSKVRIIPLSPSSFLRPGSRFKGTQQSERQVYDVQVEIKYIDLRQSFLCGYLKIQGLTEDNPTLTTYFEGEIIGSRYDFLTRHKDWGATEKIDLNHWGKFSAFRQYNKQVRKGVAVTIPNLAQRENIFMRWKEHFLVPDHRVTSINGASFEGFYYICFNQREGTISGIYFHSKSEKFQQLELKHVEDKGCFKALEFR